MAEAIDKETEVKKNFEVFEKQLPKLIKEFNGQYALMRHQEIIAIYLTVEDAVQTGQSFYEDEMFSVQEITNTPIDLGFFSRLAKQGIAPIQ